MKPESKVPGRVGTVCASIVALAALGVAAPVAARVTRIDVTSVQSPTYGGTSFGSVGPYERIIGTVSGEIDPADPHNQGIADIALAPRNARGMVDYQADLYILRPVNMARGNGRLFFEVLNRGNKLMPRFYNDSPGGNTQDTAADAGNGFLMRQGYTMAWTGWQVPYPIAGDTDISGSRPAVGNGRLFASFPVATHADGSPIVAPSREEFIVDNASPTFQASLTYEAASLDQAQATLTVRENQADPRITLPSSSWHYVDGWHVSITRPGGGIDGGAIYEFTYPAKDPVVTGMAFAEQRDVVSFLRYGVTDDAGNANPLGAGTLRKAIGMGISQSGRYLKNFIYDGFNQDEAGRKVFDGAIVDVAGGRMNWVNYEFSQSGRWSKEHEDHFQRGDQFPFTYPVLHDAISGRTDGVLARCQASGTCPKIFHIDSSAEIRQARGSLVVTDTAGNDIALPDNVRTYLFVGAQHPASGGGTPSRGICQNLSNPLGYNPVRRALLTDLDAWITNGVPPPASRYPSRSNGTLVTSDQASTGAPDIPGVNYSALDNWLNLTDYTVQPPAVGPFYPVFVGKVDADGNGVAGIRAPEVQVPTATYMGWNLRAAGHAEGELCAGTGSYIPFAQTRAERLATGDPRLSIQERYRNHGAYVSAMAHAVNGLQAARLLLPEDAEAYKQAAAHSSIGR